MQLLKRVTTPNVFDFELYLLLCVFDSPHPSHQPSCMFYYILFNRNQSFFFKQISLDQTFFIFHLFFFSILVLKHHTERETDLRSALQRSDISIIKLLISWSY